MSEERSFKNPVITLLSLLLTERILNPQSEEVVEPLTDDDQISDQQATQVIIAILASLYRAARNLAEHPENFTWAIKQADPKVVEKWRSAAERWADVCTRISRLGPKDIDDFFENALPNILDGELAGSKFLKPHYLITTTPPRGDDYNLVSKALWHFSSNYEQLVSALARLTVNNLPDSNFWKEIDIAPVDQARCINELAIAVKPIMAQVCNIAIERMEGGSQDEQFWWLAFLFFSKSNKSQWLICKNCGWKVKQRIDDYNWPDYCPDCGGDSWRGSIDESNW